MKLEAFASDYWPFMCKELLDGCIASVHKPTTSFQLFTAFKTEFRCNSMIQKIKNGVNRKKCYTIELRII